ncbi:keratin-associated protein 29-1 [Heterocephalus glaber]|uniref:Keratin-associated protein 29-1 n=1 Tax=Heterocephalus glaber TaxID=10181 RepID=A0AAX6RHT5_HETGA|nr:keratin-associated protein 29-1 [Heterocephalus glaber]
MVNSCCPGKDLATPAVPTTTMSPRGGRVGNAICLPSSCQSRTWQLVTCQESHQLPSSLLRGCEPISSQAPYLSDMSCVGFICQPICPSTACSESSTGHSPRPVSSPPPSCLDSSRCETKYCDASSCQQSSCREPVCTPGPCQAACGQSICHDVKSCQLSGSEVTSCAETSCPQVLSAAGSCQPTCCQGGSWHPTGGEDQPCSATYYQPVCYIFEPCQSVPCTPVSCQPMTYMLSSCSPACWVASPSQSCHCQPVSPISFICQPVATCQSPCSEKCPCKPVSCGQPTCGGPTSHSCGRKSPPCQPACCVTGSGKASSCGPSCFRATSPSRCKARPCLLTSCQPGCKVSCHWPMLG